MTGVPGAALPEGWDQIPGARGCTPQTCGFRDQYQELQRWGADVFGLSTQTTEYQHEMAERLHLPFGILSDAVLALCDALRLPSFQAGRQRLMKRVTLIIAGGESSTSSTRYFRRMRAPTKSCDGCGTIPLQANRNTEGYGFRAAGSEMRRSATSAFKSAMN
jgi:hypothetical protein